MTNAHNLLIILHISYNIHDIEYISDGSRLEAPTVANGIEPTLFQSNTPYIPETTVYMT